MNQGSKPASAFTDDIFTVTHSTRNVREMFSHLEEEAGNQKSMYMIVTKNPRTQIK